MSRYYLFEGTGELLRGPDSTAVEASYCWKAGRYLYSTAANPNIGDLWFIRIHDEWKIIRLQEVPTKCRLAVLVLNISLAPGDSVGGG